MRGIVGLVLVGTLLVGCSSGSSPGPGPSPLPTPSPTPSPSPSPAPTPSPSPTPGQSAPNCGPAPSRQGGQANVLQIGPQQNFVRNPAVGPSRAIGVWRVTVRWNNPDAPLTFTSKNQDTGAQVAVGVQTETLFAETCWNSTDGDARYELRIEQANRSVNQELEVS